MPLLIVSMQGTEDRLSNPEGSAALFDRVGSRDKSLKRYEGFYHEIFNEPERTRVFSDMSDMQEWLAARI